MNLSEYNPIPDIPEYRIDLSEYNPIPDILEYIEKESESWDAEYILEDKWEILPLIFQAVCKSLFIRLFKGRGLPEDLLVEKSIFFYYDWLTQYKLGYHDNFPTNDIDFSHFYDHFINFINFIKNIPSAEIYGYYGKELTQLYDLLQIAYFTAGEETDLPEDTIGESRYRYVSSTRETPGQEEFKIDVLTQTKRLWAKWVVGTKSTDISIDTLNSKSIPENELVFWLILAAFYNFSDYFGDDQLKSLRKHLKYTHDTYSKDISNVLQWCFKCYFNIIKSDKNALKKYITYKSLLGISMFAKKFNYLEFDAKNKLRKELEIWLQQPDKHFSTPKASSLWIRIKYHSLETSTPIVNKPRKDGHLSISNYINRYMKEIWKDFDRNWCKTNVFLKEKYGKNFSLDNIPPKDLILIDMNMTVNNFICYEFLRLNYDSMKSTTCAYYFHTAILYPFLYELSRLVNSHEIDEEEFNDTIELLAKILYGGEQADTNDSSACEEEDNAFADKLLEQEEEILQFYQDLIEDKFLYFEICRYITLGEIILKRKKIKIGDKLYASLLKHKASPEFFSLENGYISWERDNPDKVNDMYNTYILAEYLSSYCLDSEYRIE